MDLLFLEVNSLEESLAFYHGQLGFEIESNNPTSEPPMATLRAGHLKITLAQNLQTMLRRGRGAHFLLGVNDVDAYYQELLDLCFLMIRRPPRSTLGRSSTASD